MRMKYVYSPQQLILFPRDPFVVCGEADILGFLHEQRLIGDLIEADYYEIGDGFLSVVCFLGCSPAIELTPTTEQAFCYVHLPVPTAAPIFISGKNVKVPKCPSCQQILADLPAQLRQVEDVLAEQVCAACGKNFQPLQRNWRKSAVFARRQIVLGNIYEAEAVPDAAFMQALQQATHTAWQYAYINTSS